jgi:hypothetical protein
MTVLCVLGYESRIYSELISIYFMFELWNKFVIKTYIPNKYLSSGRLLYYSEIAVFFWLNVTHI